MKTTAGVFLIMVSVGCGGAGGPDVSSTSAALCGPGGHGGYRFTRVVTLGDPDPGAKGQTLPLPADGGYIYPMDLNDSGEVVFDAWVASQGEGVFRWQGGVLRDVFRSGDQAPGGGIFGDFGSMGHVSLNNGGEIFAPFSLSPFQLPVGIGSGAYRYRPGRRGLDAIVVPNVTPVPGLGAKFLGVYFQGDMNDSGHMVFGGLYDKAYGAPDRLNALGVFKSDTQGRLSPVAIPGDQVPGGGRLDQAIDPTINARGDVAFGGHVAGEECVQLFPGTSIQCDESLYVRDRKGGLTSIAHQGDPAPGGGHFRNAYGAKINQDGDVAFAGDLSAPGRVLESTGLFLYSRGVVTAIARPGDTMPGGGTLTGITIYPDNHDINEHGDIVFAGTLDQGEGIYLYSRGRLQLVSKVGDSVGGGNTMAGFSYFDSQPSPRINDSGDISFGVLLDSGAEAIVVAERR